MNFDPLAFASLCCLSLALGLLPACGDDDVSGHSDDTNSSETSGNGASQSGSDEGAEDSDSSSSATGTGGTSEGTTDGADTGNTDGTDTTDTGTTDGADTGGTGTESGDSTADGSSGDPTSGDSTTTSDSSDTAVDDSSESDVTTDTGFEPDSGEPDPTGGDGDGDGDACAEDEPTSLYLSPDDSNSMSSPVLIKRRIETASIINFNGFPIRRWEFLNYYHFDYTAPAPGDLSLDAAMLPAGEGQVRLHLSVGSEVQDAQIRPPMNITFVLDTSSSMGGDPMTLLKDSVHAVAANLRSGDQVSMVEWSGTQGIILAGYQITGADDQVLIDAVDGIDASGNSDLYNGLETGYNLAHDLFDINAINRLVVITDGGGALDPEVEAIVTENVTYSGENGIYLVSAGVYNTSYNDVLLDGLADAGKGANVFMHTTSEAWHIFGDDFLNTMSIAARDVQVRIDLPAGFEQVSFSGEESSEDPSEVEPQHLAPNDTMIFQQVLEVCAPEDVTGGELFELTVNWTDPWSFIEQSRNATFTYDELMLADPGQALKARAILKYVDIIELYSETPGPEREALVGTAIVDVDEALSWLPDDPDLLEILGLLVKMIP